MSDHSAPYINERLGFWILWGMWSATPFLWLWRRKWLAYPVIGIEIVGLVLIAYAMIVGNDIFYPLGREASDYLGMIVFIAMFLIDIPLTVLVLIFPFLFIVDILFIIAGTLFIVVGFLFFSYATYYWLRFGIFPLYSLYDVFEGRLTWINSTGDWIGLKSILSFVLRQTPLALVLLLIGVMMNSAHSDPRSWRFVVARYRGLKLSARPSRGAGRASAEMEN